MSVETKKSDEAIAAAAQLAATKRQARMGTLLGLTLVGLLALMWIVLAFSTTSFWTYNNISNPAASGLDDRDPGDGRDFRHHYGRHRSVGRRGRRFHERHRRLVADARFSDLGGHSHHARLRFWHRGFSCLWNHQDWACRPLL